MTLELTRYNEVEDFLADWLDVLAAREAENSLILGICLRVRDVPGLYESPLFLGVTDEAGPLAALVRTPPHKAIIRCERPEGRDEACALLCEQLRKEYDELSGVNGPVADARCLAECWAGPDGFETKMRLRCFELRELIPPPHPGGRPRLAKLHDLPLVIAWTMEFSEDIGQEANRERLTEIMLQAIGAEEIWIWEAADPPRPVSIAKSARPMLGGISIGLVYTPPEQRRQGYAGALVAELSRRLFDSGWEFVALFTDMANPISNSIYQRLGYRPVLDFEELSFVDLKESEG